MVTDILIRMWRNLGKSEDFINKQIDLEKGRRVRINKDTGEIKHRNRKKEFTQTISFRLSPFLAERLNRHIYQQLLYPTRRKGAIYRHIFTQFLKSKYIEYGFAWDEGKLMETHNKTTEEER